MLDGRGDRRLPESVHGLIAARLDGLTPDEKELLQNAAVVGRVFWTGPLGDDRQRLELALHALARREFVRRERRSSIAGETEYSFRHALIRDVAYAQIPKARRAESTSPRRDGSSRSPVVRTTPRCCRRTTSAPSSTPAPVGS